MGVDCLDLLQFHWWDYNDGSYLEALRHLADLQDEGKIRHLALTNFDTKRLGTIADRVPIVSNQVQCSIIDRRAEIRMAPFCQNTELRFLPMEHSWADCSPRHTGRPEPRRQELTTASLQKYRNISMPGGVNLPGNAGGLKQIADKHRVSIANVGLRYVLDRPAVAGVIVGARLGEARHIADNARVFGFAPDPGDIAMIEAVLAKSRDLMQIIGDCGDEYR